MGNTCRWLLVMCMLLSLTALAASTETDHLKYPFIPGVKTIKKEPQNSLISDALRKAGGLGDPDNNRGPSSPPKEREVALSADGIARVRRSASKPLTASCANQRVRKDKHSIYVRTSMWQVKDDISPASTSDFDPHFRMVFTYTQLYDFVKRQRYLGFQIVLLLTMLTSSPAVVFDLQACDLRQNVWVIENPIMKGPEIDLSNGERVSYFDCEDAEIRENHLRKVRLRVDVDLAVNREWLILKVCYGNSPKCRTIYDKQVSLERFFHPEEVEVVIMVDTLAKYLMKPDIANVKTWCELQPQW